MKTTYPQDPCRSFKEWQNFIKRQAEESRMKKVIEDFKQSIIDARTKKK